MEHKSRIINWLHGPSPRQWDAELVLIPGHTTLALFMPHLICTFLNRLNQENWNSINNIERENLKKSIYIHQWFIQQIGSFVYLGAGGRYNHLIWCKCLSFIHWVFFCFVLILQFECFFFFWALTESAFSFHFLFSSLSYSPLVITEK